MNKIVRFWLSIATALRESSEKNLRNFHPSLKARPGWLLYQFFFVTVDERKVQLFVYAAIVYLLSGIISPFINIQLYLVFLMSIPLTAITLATIWVLTMREIFHYYTPKP